MRKTKIVIASKSFIILKGLDFILKEIVAGKVSVNPVPFSNFENYPIDALADREKWTPNFNAFNLGEFLFPHSLASLLPIIVFWIVWWYFLWRRMLVKRREETEA